MMSMKMNVETRVQEATQRVIDQAIARGGSLDVEAVAVIGLVGDSNDPTVMAFLWRDECAASPVFRHAFALERDYALALTRFDTVEPPAYEGAARYDLSHAAKVLGVDRIVCLMVLERTGRFSVERDYDDLEMTRLEAVHEQLRCFSDMVAPYQASASRHLH